MPPKRGAARGGAARATSRAPSRARATPGPASRDVSPVTDPRMRSQRTPGPSRFSSSYGTPPVITSARMFGSEDASGALSSALQNVQDANDTDRQSRDPNASARDDDDDDENGASEDGDARAMPPPPPPRRRGNQGRREQEPASDALSQRSFVEESNLYGGADFQTPRPPKKPRQPSTRQSARLASRNSVASSVASDGSAPPSPSRGSREPIIPPRDPKVGPISEYHQSESESFQVQPVGNDNCLSDSVARGGRREDQIDTVPQNPPSRPERPNPVQDARNGHLVLPRPDLNSPQPRTGNTSGNDIASNPNRVPGQFIRRGPFIAPRDGGIAPAVAPSDGKGSSSPSASSDGSLDGLRDVGTDDDEPESLRSIVSHELRRLFRFKGYLRWLPKACQIFGMLVAVCWLWLILLQVFMPLDRWEGVKSSNLYPLQDWQSHWRLNIAQLVPYVVLHPFAVLTGTLDYADFRNTLRWAQINAEHNKIRLDYQAHTFSQMRRLLPELIAIKMEPVSKEWSVADNFWHALNDQVKHGSLMYSLLSLERSEDGTYTISDPHWQAVRQRIQNEDMLLSDRPAAVEDGSFNMSDEVMSYVNHSVSQAWKNWLKENEEAMKRSRSKDEEQRDEPSPNPRYQDLYGNVETVVNRKLKDLGFEGHIITRDEFITEIRHQSDQYAAQIRSEMDAMQDRLGRALEIAEDAKDHAEPPPGMSRTEVKVMIDEAVQRTLADAQIEAIAKGNIKSHLDTDLIHRKNYFSTLRGAIIDPVLTSGDYDFKIKATARQETRSRRWPWTLFQNQKDDVVFREGGTESGVRYAPAMALEKWEQDGECWCAGLTDDKNISGVADISVLTAATIVPQHLVVEHIASGASFDPDSMPKDLEVWIQAPNDKRRRSIEHWSSQRWPDAKRGDAHRLVSQGLVKVGQFQYDNSVAKGESQIFRLSEELLGLDAQTRHVLIRAKTNYGSEDHTCFYRLRLFGEEGRGQDDGALG